MWKACKSGLWLAGLLLGTIGATSTHANNSLSPAEKKAGWILLFDGVDKDAHWRQGESGDDNAKNPWTLVDSSMKTVDAYSFLCSKSTEQFSDLEFSAEWRMSQGGNSGLFIRVLKSTYNDGFEYAILDDVNGGDKGAVSKNAADKLPNGKMAYIKRTGAIYDVYPTTKNGVVGGQFYDSTFAKPYDQWNQGIIWANGNFIESWLNGKKVVDAEIGTADWQARFLLSKWGDSKSALSDVQKNTWAKHPKGSVCLQAHGSGAFTYFRNLKVRPFTPGEVLVSPTVTPESGTFSTTIKVGLEVAVTGAVIHYTLDGSEPTEASPTYLDSISISASATLKAKSFRAKFQSSATTTATFTKAGSAILSNDLSPVPQVSLSPISQGFIVHNKNASNIQGSVFSLSGSKVSEFSIREDRQEYAASGLKTGVYLVKLQRGNWMQVQKIALH